MVRARPRCEDRPISKRRQEMRHRRWIGRSRTLCALVVLAALPWAASLDAQVLYGSIVGNVRDASGAALPGATVVVTHNETKAKRETVSDAVGAYRFSTVQPGTYTVVDRKSTR